MDVSWSEAQRAETNVIARIDDNASTTMHRRQCIDDAMYGRTMVRPLKKSESVSKCNKTKRILAYILTNIDCN
jgi:hypothetical protein